MFRLRKRYRKRYLDLILDNKVKSIFEIRAKTLEAMRDFMKQNNFLEVETPLLQSIYGGAAAKPFKTHCDAFNSDVLILKKRILCTFSINRGILLIFLPSFAETKMTGA